MNTASNARLRIAFLGVDRHTPALARAALEHFELAGVCEFDNTDPLVAAALPTALVMGRKFEHWETLLDPAMTDAVVVARSADQELRADQLRKFAQEGITLLASHPVVDSMLVYFELDMIRGDTKAILVPYLPRRRHPAIGSLAAMVAAGADSPIGQVEQILVTSSVPNPTRDEVVRRFAVDVDLLRAIVGDLTRLGAMVGGNDERLASLGVQMSGPKGIAARWSVDPTASDFGTQISLVGSRGKSVVTISADDRSWTQDNSEYSTAAGGEPWEPADEAISQLLSAMQHDSEPPDWVDAARSVELAETIERSLRKSRTIELHNEDFSEEGTFKGVMASLGCGLLLAAMAALGGVALLETVSSGHSRTWQYLLLGVLGLFLLMQTLVMVFNRRERPPAGQ